MHRAGLVACCGLFVAFAGIGVAWGAGVPGDVRVEVTLTTWSPFPDKQTQVFTLTCDPPAGTLPLAARICGDIGAHPTAMLDPRQVGPNSICGAVPNQPSVSVVATGNGRTAAFGSSCDNPGATAAAIYLAAVRNDQPVLDTLEPQLPCDEDPVLFANPTITSIWACLRGLWTPAAGALIKSAEAVPRIAALGAARLFPRDVGARRCEIPSRTRTVAGQCGVLVNDATPSTFIVTFVEYWASDQLAPTIKPDLKHGTTDSLAGFYAKRPSARHNWRVVIRNDRVASVSESGARPPQLWP